MARRVRNLADLKGKRVRDGDVEVRYVPVPHTEQTAQEVTLRPDSREIEEREISRSVAIGQPPNYQSILGEIADGVRVLASREPFDRWVFKIQRNQSGDIETVVADGGRRK